MSSQTALSRSLNVEDFRRLGVRPNEVRLGVIRGAASRNAMPLANQLLSFSGDDETDHHALGDDSTWNDSWLQLSRVVTSTYRLLDPRLRPNPHQRAYIGRILPLDLNAATTDRFQSNKERTHKRTSQPVSSGTVASLSDTAASEPVPPPVSGLFSRADMAADTFATPTAHLSDAEIWQLSLDDRDLASGNRIRRQRNTSSLNVWIWSSMVTCGVLVGSILGWNSLSKSTDTIASVKQNHPTLPEPNTAESQPSISDGGAGSSAPFELTEEPSDQPTAPVDSTVIEPEPSIASLPDVTDYLSIDPSSKDALVDASASLVPAPDLDAVGVVPDPEPSMATTNLEKPLPIEEVVPSVQQDLFPAPQPEDIALAQRQLLQSIDAASVNITSVNFKTIRDRVADAHSRFSPGSVDHYAAASMLGSFAWLESGPRQPALSDMTSRLGAYELDEDEVWTNSYIDAAQHVTLPDDLNQFFYAGFGLIETLIKREAFDHASEVLTLIQQRSEQFASASEEAMTSRENEIRTLVASYQKSLQYTERISTTAHRVLRLEGPIESLPTDVSGGSSLGRFYCLVLGDWCQGLRFLAETSDPRLSALAKTELELHRTDPFLSDPIAWAEVADQWLRAADRMSGRYADQIRVHAMELLNQSSWRASAVAQSDARQRTEAIQKQLPQHLNLDLAPTNANQVIAVAATAEIESPTAKTSVQEPSKQKPIASDNHKEINDWLVGRVSVDGEDLGVRLRYQLDVTITPTMLQSIEKQLRQTLKNALIEFEGEFTCDNDQWVILSRSPPSETNRETVLLDGEPLERDQISNSTRLLIRAGKHSLSWQILLADVETAFACSLRDARTGQRVILTTSPKQADTASTGDLTVSVMRSGD